jgi:GDPmannose 4,6-dehydratase
VQNVVEVAFASVGLNWQDFVKKDARFMRPAEPQRLLGNASKASELLQWTPQIAFEQLISEMTAAELARLAAASSDSTSTRTGPF